MKRRELLKYVSLLAIYSNISYSRSKILPIECYPTNNNLCEQRIEQSCLYYGVFFERKTHNVLLVYSFDGVVFSQPIRLFIDGISGQQVNGRDPSIIFHDGIWYISVTSDVPDLRDFIVFYSKDLITWEQKNVCLDGNIPICSKSRIWADGEEPALHLWAPEFIAVDGKLYITASIYQGKDKLASTKKNKFSIGIAEVINLSFSSFGKMRKIFLSDSSFRRLSYSRIDAVISKDLFRNIYILAVKRENFGVIDIFESMSIDRGYRLIGTINLHSGFEESKWVDIEAPIVYKIDNRQWVLAFDAYTDAHGILFVTTTDFIAFTNPRRLRLGHKNIIRMRHGTIQKSLGLSDNEKIINQLCFLLNEINDREVS